MRSSSFGFLLLLSWMAFSQQGPQTLKEVPLTRDEFEVYKAFIDDSRARGDREDLLVVESTGPLTPDEGDYATCMKGFPQPAPKQHPRIFERLIEKKWNVRLVNAPIKLPPAFSGGVEMHPGETPKSPPDEESNSRQTRAQCSIQFSEIIFDRHHRRAAFWAGMSCTSWGGRGGTLVFRRVGQGWSQTDTSCPTGIP